MEFLIKDRIPAPAFVPNSFLVRITVMHGDGDLYTGFVVPGFEASSQISVELLKDLLCTLDKMKAAFIHTGRGGNRDDHYAYAVPEFEPWFSNEDLTQVYSPARYKPNSTAGAEHLKSLAQEVAKHYSRNFRAEWPDDATMGGAFGLHNESTLESYEVRYVDSAGTEHAVEVQA